MTIYPLVLGAMAACISWMACAVMLRLSRQRGWVDAPASESHKQHARVVPNTGGVGILLGIALPMLAVVVSVGYLSITHVQDWLPTIAVHWAGLQATQSLAVWLLLALLVLHVLGLMDDRRPIGAWVKLAVQLAVVCVLVIFADMRILEMFGPVVSIVASVLWITLVMNAINFMDNMDGLAAGVAAIICTIYAAFLLIGGQWFIASLACLTAGASLGFLYWNRPPAKLFMGDAGSLVLGLMLAVISVRATYVQLPNMEVVASTHWLAMLTPFGVLAVPFYDLISVVCIRLRAGRSPMTADNNHLSHRLVAAGYTPREAVNRIWLITLITGIGGLMLLLSQPV